MTAIANTAAIDNPKKRCIIMATYACDQPISALQTNNFSRQIDESTTKLGEAIVLGYYRYPTAITNKVHTRLCLQKLSKQTAQANASSTAPGSCCYSTAILRDNLVARITDRALAMWARISALLHGWKKLEQNCFHFTASCTENTAGFQS